MKNKNKKELLVDYFFELKNWDNQPKEFYIKNKINYGRFCKEAKDLLIICNEDLKIAKNKLDRIKKWADKNCFDGWVISTVFKMWPELEISKI